MTQLIHQVDKIKSSALPIILKKFIFGNCDVDLTIKKRGAAPNGGSEVHFKCPVNSGLRTIQFDECGLIQRIRSISCSMKVSPAIANRMVEAAKGVLLNFISDVYIHTDHCHGNLGGESPGFGISITAETTEIKRLLKDKENKTKAFFTGEAYCPPMEINTFSLTTEDIGRQAANSLLDEINKGRCIDSVFQPMIALFMALGEKNVSKVLFGPLSKSTIQFLRDLKDFTGVVFKLESS